MGKELKKMLYTNIFKDEMSEFDIRNLIGAAGSEYYNLGRHLSNVIDKLQGRNKKIYVNATTLKGDYILKCNFLKVVQYQYKYTQNRLNKYNKLKKVRVNGKDLSLDDNFSFLSDMKLDLNRIHPYFGDDIESEEECFIEEKHKKKISTNSSNLFNTKTEVYYVFENNNGYRELSINVDDIKHILSILNVNATVLYDGRTFTTDQEIENEYFDTTFIEKNSLRVMIDGHDREDNVFADTDYFFEEIEGRATAVFEDDSEEDIFITKKFRNKNELVIRKKNKDLFTLNPVKLSFEVSSININRQMMAFFNLIGKPLTQNKNILKLAYGRSVFPNESPINIKENDYIFLKDSKRDGTLEQREFVNKALATKDFMLLSGPPGTGKTTCILELIYQILKTKPDARILLSASTHIAIDNVIERIADEFNEDLAKHNIYPIRLGREGVVSENKKLTPFIYDSIKEEDETLAEYYLFSSNLVCGTAMGINKYIRNNDDNSDFMRHRFDYLIIDEASKTTLQEFIVPAVMCEKQILIGDVNQLSPYTDTFQLEVILKSQKQMTQQLEKLFYFNFVLHRSYKKNKKQLFVLDDIDVLNDLSELGFENYHFIVETDDINYLFGNKSTVISKELYLKFLDFIPTDYLVHTLEELPSSNHFRYRNKVDGFIDDVERKREKSDNVIGSNWAKEVAWRYARFYELKKMDERYKQEIDWLIIDEKAPKLKEEIEKLGDISIPSILVKLQEGITSINRRYDNRLGTGFRKEELNARLVELVYQHRMTSTIAEYAEKSIYEAGKYKTSSAVMKRDDDLNLFSDSNIFVNVKVDQLRKKENEKEAQEIIRIIDLILDRSASVNRNFTVAILTFYKSQQKMIKDYLNRYLKKHQTEMIRSDVPIDNVTIELYTVDKYQGKEADVTINSLTRNSGLGFMNVPNRINVSLTRAKYYRIVVGDSAHFRSLDHKFIHNIVLTSKLYEEGELK